jgi:protein-L-isoaspartate(D-aspartate) O-methyltransferase
MVDCQIRTYDVTVRPLIAALDAVPREAFVPDALVELAYSDAPIEVATAHGTRTLLLPLVLAKMLQALDLAPHSRVLDVACATGYASALLAHQGMEVVGLDEDSGLIAQAMTTLASLGYSGFQGHVGALDQGVAGGAFDAILIQGAVLQRPETLLGQLTNTGRLICIEGIGRAARVQLYQRSGIHAGCRTVFDAAAPVLEAFRPAPVFEF